MNTWLVLLRLVVCIAHSNSKKLELVVIEYVKITRPGVSIKKPGVFTERPGVFIKIPGVFTANLYITLPPGSALNNCACNILNHDIPRVFQKP